MIRTLIVVAMLVAGCGGGPTATPTVGEMLATIHGDGDVDPAVVAEFEQILDTLQAGGTCDPEPDRERIADLMVASWTNSGKRDTLLEWARALASICGGGS